MTHQESNPSETAAPANAHAASEKSPGAAQDAQQELLRRGETPLTNAAASAPHKSQLQSPAHSASEEAPQQQPSPSSSVSHPTKTNTPEVSAAKTTTNSSPQQKADGEETTGNSKTDQPHQQETQQKETRSFEKVGSQGDRAPLHGEGAGSQEKKDGKADIFTMTDRIERREKETCAAEKDRSQGEEEEERGSSTEKDTETMRGTHSERKRRGLDSKMRDQTGESDSNERKKPRIEEKDESEQDDEIITTEKNASHVRCIDSLTAQCRYWKQAAIR